MLSVVVPIYNEEENIVAFNRALDTVLDQIEQTTGETWEIVYVNDGGVDASLSLLLQINERNPQVTVVEFSRNFGHQAALTAGLKVARGDAIILMDGDFQDPPEVLPRIVAAWKKGAKVVLAERTSRAEKGLRSKLFPLFYKVMGWLSDFPIPLNAGIFGLLDRQAADAINSLSEGNRYLPGMRAWIGFPTAVVFYDRAERAAGEAKQTLPRLIKYAMDAIFSFSYKPLRLGMALGMVVLSVSLVMAMLLLTCNLVGVRFLGLPPNSGTSSTLFAILVLGGIQLVCTGLLGEYIGRIYDEVRRRPMYLVHKLHQAMTLPQVVTEMVPEATVRVQVGSAVLAPAVSEAVTLGPDDVVLGQNAA
ncbi:MAG TPA: glycosyltransferase family 2 protein [Candidatus Angelobacter sp.]|nr:glycosyltransferase family 2 protein [Candidatus Angelobacter sp.]